VGIYWKAGKSPNGDATEKGHKKWVKCGSLSLSTNRVVDSTSGHVADRVKDNGRVSELTLTKDMDTASMNLFKSTCNGHGENMEIHVTRPGSADDKAEIVYLKYILENALVTSYAFHSAGTRPMETLTLNFTKITMTHVPQNAGTTPGSNNTVSHDNTETTAKGG
jgi:type VI secretion system secreted protein Hcp